jgi:hypothetical protein
MITTHGNVRRADIVLADALLIVTVGVFLVALAFSRARGHAAFASPLFWTGEILIFAFVAHRVLCRSSSDGTREAIVILYAGAQYVIRWAYSPDMFRYSDELQHLRSLLNVLGTHHLFKPNFNLPVSPFYPGMENAAAEIAQVGQISAFAAGLAVAGLSHLLLAASLIVFFREVSRSSRVACLGALIYALNPNAQFFDSSFHYETVALPFLVLGLFFSVRFARHVKGGYWNYAACIACLLLVVMTHHLAAIAAVVILAMLGAASIMFTGGAASGLRLLLCCASAATAVFLWIYFVAPMTTEYLAGAARGLIDGLVSLGQVSGKSRIPASQASPIDRALSLSGAATTVILLLIGVWLMYTREPMQRAVGWTALSSYLVIGAIRVLVSNGAELSTRALTFASFVTALTVAAVLEWSVSTAPIRRRVGVRSVTGHGGMTAVATFLLLAAITTGIPAYWERLPGTFRVDGLDSGIDNQGISRAQWAAQNLQSGSRYFGDITSVTLLSTYADLDPIRDPKHLYYSTELTDEDARTINDASGVYIDVDYRMSQATPITGIYFPVDDEADTHSTPIPLAALAKFDNTPGISRVYDSGDDHFYDLRGSRGSQYGS